MSKFNLVKYMWYRKVHPKLRKISGLPPLSFQSKRAITLKNYRIYGNAETLTRSYSGSAPLSFPIEDGTVSNYRVYGNTVNGESVGDRTENILNELPQNRTNKGITFTNYDNKYIRITGISSDAYAQTDAAIIYLEAGTYSIRFFAKNSEFNLNIFALLRHLDNTNIITINVNGGTFTLNNGETIRFVTGVIQNNVEINTDVYYMVIKQSQIPDEYEPYGYKIPITNNSETANIYLDEPLTKQGDNADYIDYAEQKRYNADGTNEDVTLPALPAQSSSNALSVGTAVQPSSVAVEVNEILSCGDKVTDSQSVNYGKYKIPVTLTAGSTETTDIYLDEPLAKSGNNADYIDYATQKRHNSDGTESSVTLPEIAVTAGTNTLTVGTEVQPSSVEIKGRIKAAGGD